MDGTTLIWIIVAIVALVAVAVIGFIAYRRRGARADARRHEQAEDMRAKAREAAFAAEEVEAREAEARADAAAAAAAAERGRAQAAQAALDEKRYANDIDAHGAEAAEHRAKEEEILRKADELDPFTAANDAPGPRRSTAGTAPVVDDGSTPHTAAHTVPNTAAHTDTVIADGSTRPTAAHGDPVIEGAPARPATEEPVVNEPATRRGPATTDRA